MTHPDMPELPELPPLRCLGCDQTGRAIYGHTAEQMRAYALAAALTYAATKDRHEQER